jgi:hypothetical protein
VLRTVNNQPTLWDSVLPSPFVGVPVRVVKHHNSSVQQTCHPSTGEPLQGLSGGRCAVHPRRGHHDQCVNFAQRLLGDRCVERPAVDVLHRADRAPGEKVDGMKQLRRDMQLEG